METRKWCTNKELYDTPVIPEPLTAKDIEFFAGSNGWLKVFDSAITNELTLIKYLTPTGRLVRISVSNGIVSNVEPVR